MKNEEFTNYGAASEYSFLINWIENFIYIHNIINTNFQQEFFYQMSRTFISYLPESAEDKNHRKTVILINPMINRLKECHQDQFR